jgi:hypothetical protein
VNTRYPRKKILIIFFSSVLIPFILLFIYFLSFFDFFPKPTFAGCQFITFKEENLKEIASCELNVYEAGSYAIEHYFVFDSVERMVKFDQENLRQNSYIFPLKLSISVYKITDQKEILIAKDLLNNQRIRAHTDNYMSSIIKSYTLEKGDYRVEVEKKENDQKFEYSGLINAKVNDYTK